MTWAFDETPEHLALAEQILAAQPFSVLLGTRITRFGGGLARLELPFRPELRQQHGYAHGGVLSCLADNALTFAGGTALGVKVLTAGFNLEYLRPATRSLLVADAEVVTATSRHVVAHCRIRSIDEDAVDSGGADGTVVGVAQRSVRMLIRPLPSRASRLIRAATGGNGPMPAPWHRLPTAIRRLPVRRH